MGLATTGRHATAKVKLLDIKFDYAPFPHLFFL